MAHKTSPATTSKTRLSLWFDRYIITALGAGFVLMAFELIAARIMAPSVGASTYVWTSIIGVIIGALALGYQVGGLLADKRATGTDIGWLLLATAGVLLLTYTIHQPLLRSFSDTGVDLRIQAVLGASFLFLPGSLLLGMISPYLARMRITSISQSGRTVASLNAANAIGGILGTFGTGFIGFSYFGSRETLAALIMLTVALAWLHVRQDQVRIFTLTTILCLGWLVIVKPVNASAETIQVDTLFAHYQISTINYAGRPVKAISTGPGAFQSGRYADGSPELAFGYTRKIASIVQQKTQNSHILILGGGTFTLPEYLAREYPASKVTVVEIDPGLTQIAQDYFFFKQPSNLRIINADARTYLSRTQDKYDIIITDIYNDMSVPFSLATEEFTDLLTQRSQLDGVVVANIIGSTSPRCRQLLSSLTAAHVKHFANATYLPVDYPNLKNLQNIIGVFSASKLDWIQGHSQLKPYTQDAIRLTDSFAPVERLHAQCEL